MSGMPQTYANHRRTWWPYHYVLVPILVANFVLAASDAVRHPSNAAASAAVMAFALVLLATCARSMALVVQNRVIRLEQRLRLARVLPADLAARVEELGTSQLVGLRFASDGEVADLVRRCLAGELKRSDDVKRQIKQWVPDTLRV